jgi:hypothetical protein
LEEAGNENAFLAPRNRYYHSWNIRIIIGAALILRLPRDPFNVCPTAGSKFHTGIGSIATHTFSPG